MRGELGEWAGRIRHGERQKKVPEGQENEWKYIGVWDRGAF